MATANKFDKQYLDHPAMRTAFRDMDERDSLEFWNLLDDTVGNIISRMKDNGQLQDQRALPMVAAGNKNSVLTGGVSALTAVDAGADATINVAAHTIRYGFGDVTYNSGAITGLAFETTYYVYADDPEYDGGAVTYLSLTEPDNLTANTGRYYVGAIVTPADGGGGTTGGGGGGAGTGEEPGPGDIWP